MRPILFFLVPFIVYCALFPVMVFLRIFPGYGTLWLWGIILPTGAILYTWHWFKKHQTKVRRWAWLAGAASVLYVGLGCGTIWLITQIWTGV